MTVETVLCPRCSGLGQVPLRIRRSDGICPTCNLRPKTKFGYCRECTSTYQKARRKAKPPGPPLPVVYVDDAHGFAIRDPYGAGAVRKVLINGVLVRARVKMLRPEEA